MKRLFVLFVLLAPAAVLAQEEGVSYVYLELGHVRAEEDVLDVGDGLDAKAWSIEGSFEVGDHIHLFGGYTTGRPDDFEDDVSASELLFGAGVHFDIRPSLSVYGRVGFADAKVEIMDEEFTDDGAYAAAGIRWMPSPRFEVRGGADYYDSDVLAGETFAVVAGDLYLTEVVSLTLEYTHHDDASAVMIGGRFYFGKDPARYR